MRKSEIMYEKLFELLRKRGPINPSCYYLQVHVHHRTSQFRSQQKPPLSPNPKGPADPSVSHSDEMSKVLEDLGSLNNNLRYADDTTLMAESEEELEPFDKGEKGE